LIFSICGPGLSIHMVLLQGNQGNTLIIENAR
jgi:hypothetical protein